MPRISEDKKKARAMAKFARLAQQIGGSIQAPDIQAATAELAEKRHELPAFYEAEGVLRFLEKPASFTVKICKREGCKEPFGTNYRAVAYCSDNCRRRDLERTGIRWNPHKPPEERWQGEPPLVLPPQVIRALIALLSQVEPELLSKLDESQISEPDPIEIGRTISPEQPQQSTPAEENTGGSVFRFLRDRPTDLLHRE